MDGEPKTYSVIRKCLTRMLILKGLKKKQPGCLGYLLGPFYQIGIRLDSTTEKKHMPTHPAGFAMFHHARVVIESLFKSPPRTVPFGKLHAQASKPSQSHEEGPTMNILKIKNWSSHPTWVYLVIVGPW